MQFGFYYSNKKQTDRLTLRQGNKKRCTIHNYTRKLQPGGVSRYLRNLNSIKGPVPRFHQGSPIQVNMNSFWTITTRTNMCACFKRFGTRENLHMHYRFSKNNMRHIDGLYLSQRMCNAIGPNRHRGLKGNKTRNRYQAKVRQSKVMDISYRSNPVGRNGNNTNLV